MNFIKHHWHLVVVFLLTALLGVGVFVTSQRISQEKPIEEAPEAAACSGYTSQSACNAAGCTGGFTCRWSSQEDACKKTETRCTGPTPPTRGYDGPDAGDFCSGNSCDVGSAFSSSCYVNHYVSKETDDPTVTDPVKTGVGSSSLGLQNCGAEQIDVTCEGKSDSVSRRYTQDCGEKTIAEKTPTPTTKKTNTPTPTTPVTGTPTSTPTNTPTGTPTSTATPTPTSPPGSTPTPTHTPTPTPPPGSTPTPTPTTPPTPNVPIAGAGPSVLGASVVAGGFLLLLLGLIF